MVSRKIIWGYHRAIVNLSNPGVFAPKLGAGAGWALREILRSACRVLRFESQVGLWGVGFPLLSDAPVDAQHSGSLLFPLIQRPASYHLCLVLPDCQLLLLKSPLSARHSTEHSC